MNIDRINDDRAYHNVVKNIFARCIVDEGYNGSVERVGIALVDMTDNQSGIYNIVLVAPCGYYQAPGTKPVINKEQAIAQLKNMGIYRIIVELN
jgi:hypothetical protein